MLASIIDLRYKMKNVLKAIERNETVTVMYHGKPKAKLVPISTTEAEMKLSDHPFVGMHDDDSRSVEDTMENLRGGRYRDI